MCCVNYDDLKTFTPNHRIACEPFPSNTVEKEIRNGVAVPKQKNTLTRLRVLFQGTLSDSSVVDSGYHVYVRSELFNAFWAKEVFSALETRFVLVPDTEIVLVEPPPAEEE